MIKARTYVFMGLSAMLVALSVYTLYPASSLPASAHVDHITVLKSKRKLQVFEKGIMLKEYTIALGRHPVGAKEYEGDGKTPEGLYYINDKTTESRYHRNLAVSYPNDSDRKHAAGAGQRPGGDIKIHGLQNGLGIAGRLHTLMDWTAGCIALTNTEIDDLYDHTAIGTEIEIKP